MLNTPAAQAELRPLDFAPFADAIAALSPERAAKIETLVLTLDLAALQELLWDGTITSVELTTFYLSRIVRHKDALRAFLELNPAALDHARAADATLVDRLRAAGAVILGKTSLSEFAGVVSFGTPRRTIRPDQDFHAAPSLVVDGGHCIA